MPRAIVHLDGDAFFAAVEQAADPRLRGKPVAVGGERRGVIASASYEARRFGIKAAMPTVQARRLCPGLIVISGDFERYEQFSRIMFSYAEDHTPLVEVQGLDEGYYDLTPNRGKSPAEIAAVVQRAIRQTLKITVSEGLASNKLVSQIASKAHKPAGFRIIPAGEETAFLHPLPNRWLPGVGPQLSSRLNAAGLAEIRHIASMPPDLLELVAGSQARQLRLFAQGVDDRSVLQERTPQKTYSAQQTFGADVTDETFAEATLRRMADELFAKVRGDRRAIRTLTVTVKFNDHEQSQTAESLREPTNLETDIYARLRGLMKRAWNRRVSLRMVGLKLSNLYDGRFAGELDLPGEGASHERRERAVTAVEDLRHRYGSAVILRGHDLVLRDGPADPTLLPPPPPLPLPPPPRPPASAPGSKASAPAAPVVSRISLRVSGAPRATYIPLGCHSHYSFLDSTLSPAQIIGLAQRHELPAIALTDLGNLHGAGEFAAAAQAAGVRPVFGAELSTPEGAVFVYVRDRTGYTNLCRLLSRAQEARDGVEDDTSVAARQRLPISRAMLAAHADGLLAVSADDRLAEVFGPRFFRAVTRPEHADHPRAILVPRTHYGAVGERRHFDIVQSIRTRTLLQQPHPEKRVGEFPFRAPAALPAWVHRHPALLRRTQELADACAFEFPLGAPQFPEFHPPDGSSPRVFLQRLVMGGLRDRYGAKAEAMRGQVDEELGIIAAVGYEALFLHTWSVLQDCRAAGIDWITRGSAADSLVCYCLGISNVCPIRFELYFKRFLNPERMAMHKLPDIDIDFPHDRKDDVVNLLFARFGPDHCAVVGGFSTFQARSAFGDIGKVLGLSEGQIRRFTERFPWNGGTQLRAVLERGIETRDLPVDEEPFRSALDLAALLEGRPRNPKMHPCGVVLTRQPVHELTPTFRSNKGWPTTHYDMDITEALGLVKMDILAQGGLAVLRDARAAIQRNHGLTIDLGSLSPWNDPQVWELIASGGSRAVHHIESPAMLNLCRMTNVREIDGLVAIVSVIRPGAANENKKLAFTRRYQGMEPPVYPHPCLEPCLRSTFGLVVYEEHILQIAETYAGLSAGRADVLRRALVKQKPRVVAEIEPEFFAAAAARGHALEKTREVWELITSFQGYAFNKAHSTAYGVEAYEAAWIKSRYPAEFLAGVLTHGKGFYSTLVYVLECHRLGLRIRPPAVNDPGPGYQAGTAGIRVPVGAVSGLTEATHRRLLAERARAPFLGLPDFVRRVGPLAEELEALVRVGAFDEFGDTRLQQFWQVQQLASRRGRDGATGQSWLLPPPTLEALPTGDLCEPARRERLQAEWDLLGFTASAHPLELFDDIHWGSYCPLRRAGQFIGREITVCGLVVEQRIHHQVTGEPMKFLTVADRSDIASTDLFAETYRSYGLATVRYPVLEVTAKVEPYENGRGWTLRALRAGKPRQVPARTAKAA
ncbi:MAG: DNA polymerase IV [Verrucomicrobiales bacterium]|nr:DNA polymerase IV [Verrucomicrobiales bacterium]